MVHISDIRYSGSVLYEVFSIQCVYLYAKISTKVSKSILSGVKLGKCDVSELL
jgi:hypothetical protein